MLTKNIKKEAVGFDQERTPWIDWTKPVIGLIPFSEMEAKKVWLQPWRHVKRIQWEVQEVMRLMKTMATPRKPLLCDYLLAFYNNAVEAR